MDMRETILVFACFALGPLLIYSDGGIKTDLQLRAETLVPIEDKTSLGVCRSRVKYYHYCRHHVMTDTDDVIFRYRFLAAERDSIRDIQYLRSSETGEVTTSLGQKYLWHRIVFIALVSISALIRAVWELWKFFAPAKRAPKPLPQNQYIAQRSARPVRGGSVQKSFGKR